LIARSVDINAVDALNFSSTVSTLSYCVARSSDDDLNTDMLRVAYCAVVCVLLYAITTV
jgi:hypothetical protein